MAGVYSMMVHLVQLLIDVLQSFLTQLSERKDSIENLQRHCDELLVNGYMSQTDPCKEQVKPQINGYLKLVIYAKIYKTYTV